MSIEWEQRYPIELCEYEAISSKYNFSKSVLQEDLTFGPHGVKSMEIDGWIIRLRSSVNGVSLQYKGSLGLNQTEEISLQVDALESSIELLLKIGLQPALLIRKERCFTTIGSFLVSLDLVEHLGYFVEIESTTSVVQKAEFRQILKDLGLESKAPKGLYGDLLIKELSENPISYKKHQSALNTYINKAC